MLYTKYQGSLSIGFRPEDFFFFPDQAQQNDYVKYVTLGQSQIFAVWI